MSKVDKFVLLPFERYERLLKDENATQKVHVSEKVENSILEKKDQEHKNPKTHNQETDIEYKSKKTESVESAKSDFKESSPLSENNTVPPLPPGIPVKNRKIKHNSFKWHSLF